MSEDACCGEVAENAAANVPTAILPPPLPTNRGPNYFVRHWRGDLSLARSFWLNTACVNVVIAIANATTGQAIFSVGASAVIIIVFWAVNLPLNVWQYVGVWRSSAHHESAGIRNLARGFTCLVAFFAVIGCFGVVIPQVMEAVTMVTGDSRIGDFKVNIIANGSAVEFVGGIKMGAAESLRAALQRAPKARLIYIESTGGRVGEAVELAALIRERRMDTYVPNFCCSSAVIFFMGGQQRTLRQGAQIGFHAASFAGMQNPKISAVVNSLIQERGVPKAFLDRVCKSSQFVFPPADELVKEHVLTRVSKGAEFALPSSDLGKLTLGQLKADFIKHPLYAAYARVSPKEFEAGVEATFNGLKSGKAAFPAASELNALVMNEVKRRFPSAGDDVVEAWLDLLIQCLDSSDSSPAVLRAIMRPSERSPADMEKLPNWPLQTEQEICARLLSGPIVPANAEDLQRGKRALQRLLLRSFTGLEAAAISGAAENPDRLTPKEAKAACDLVKRLYKEIRSLPRNERLIVGRFILQG